MIEAFDTQAWEVRSAALRLSPVDLEGLDRDLAYSHGAGYRYLSLKASPILAGARSSNPHPHCGRWAFDIDGLVFVTAIPYEAGARARGSRDAREVLDAVLSRALDLAEKNGWGGGSAPIPDVDHRGRASMQPTRCKAAAQGSPASHRRATLTAGCSMASRKASGSAPEKPRRRTSVPCPTHGQSGHSLVAPTSDARALDAALDAAHYTRLPQWALSGSLPLTVSERIVMADAMDVMGSGTVLSYQADRARLYARTGLKPSTVTVALRGLVAKGILRPVANARGRFAVAWERLARFVRQCREGSIAMGSAITEADMRRRLSATEKGLAVPVWAVQLCGATEAALLLAKAWAIGHGGGDGRVWAAGTTLATWLPGSERSLRRARASLAEQGIAHATGQYTYDRLYNHGIARNKTVEISVTATAVARALAVRGIDFGADLTAIVSSFFCEDASVRLDAALWDTQRAAKTHLRHLRRSLAILALQGSPCALSARAMVDAGTASRSSAPWRLTFRKALPSAA